MLTLKLLGRGLLVSILTLVVLVWHGFPLVPALWLAGALGLVAMLPILFLGACTVLIGMFLWGLMHSLADVPTAWDVVAGPGRAFTARVIEGRAPVARH